MLRLHLFAPPESLELLAYPEFPLWTRAGPKIYAWSPSLDHHSYESTPRDRARLFNIAHIGRIVCATSCRWQCFALTARPTATRSPSCAWPMLPPGGEGSTSAGERKGGGDTLLAWKSAAHGKQISISDIHRGRSSPPRRGCRLGSHFRSRLQPSQPRRSKGRSRFAEAS